VATRTSINLPVPPPQPQPQVGGQSEQGQTRVHSSIRTRIALVFGISSLLLALVLSLIVSQTTRRQLEREAGTELAELAYQLDRGMFERYRDIQIVASSFDQFQNPSATSAQQKALLEKLQSTYPDYAWIGLTDPNGKVLVSTGGLLEGQSVARRPWFMAAKTAPFVFVGDVHEALLLASLLPPLPADAEPRRFVDVAVPIFNPDGSLRGVLGAHLSWNWAREVENSLLQALQNRGDRSQAEMFVLSSPDATGQRKLVLAPRYFAAAVATASASPSSLATAIATAPRSITGFSTSTSTPLSLSLSPAQSAQLSRLAETVYQSSDRYLAQTRWPSATTGTSTSTDGSSSGGDNSYTYLTGVARADGYRDYRGLDWLVLVRQPTEQAFAPGVNLQWQILGWGGFLGVIFAGAGWVLAGQISRPLLALAQAANHLRLRQPSAPVTTTTSATATATIGANNNKLEEDIYMPLPTLAGKDELATVSRSLNSLVSDLIVREQELSSLNSRLDEQVVALREREAQLLVEVEERTKAEQALLSSQEQLRHSQKMEAIGQLAGGIAHDFNNILTVILNLCDLLLTDLDLPNTNTADDTQTRQQLTEIQKAAYRAVSLTRQLLIFSRRQVVQTKLLDLNSVIGELSTMLERLLGEDLQFQMLLADRLPKIKADTGQIEQILMNLAVNARDAMPQGGRLLIETASVVLDNPDSDDNNYDDPTAKGSSSGSGAGSYVMLRVSDTGSGMDAATRARIFEPFFTTKEPGKGTGLGLATVYGIVQQSNGFITVDSEPGQGTSFSVYLPLPDKIANPNAHPDPDPTRDADADADADERPIAGENKVVVPPATATTLNAAPATSGTPLERRNEKILVVEDQSEIRWIIRRVLQREGYQVEEATSGKHALELAAQDVHFDLVLTDISMPEMTGLEFGRRLASLHPNLPVLYMSGHSERTLSTLHASESSTRAGAGVGVGAGAGQIFVFLEKPFTTAQLVSKVRQILGD
jgi:two-component system, cell cycle sensor histidine kinase and response regulator CckA